MAESSESLQLFECSGLDINENMPNSQNCSFSNAEPVVETTSSIICSENDSAFIETANSSEISDGCIKASGTCSEILSANFDVALISRDECASNQKADSGIHDSENNIVDSAINQEIDFGIHDSENNIVDIASDQKTESGIHDSENNIVDIASDQKAESGIHDSENNIVDSAKLIECGQNFSENCGVMISDFIHEENDTEFKDEEFHDAVQFFKDPSSLVFLENAGSLCAPVEPLMVRSSLYQKFDPLHAKFFSQSNNNSNELQEITENEIETEHNNLGGALVSDNPVCEIETDKPQDSNNAVLVEVTSDELQSNISQEIHVNNQVPGIINKHLSNISPRESLGNVLISFDSPVINKDTASHPENEKVCDPEKMYSEEDLQQTLKIQELTLHETFLKKQQELEENFSKRQQELEAKLEQQKCLFNSLYAVLKETVDLVYDFSEKEKQLKEKVEIIEKENIKLKDDLKTSVEDIQSVETTFSDFHKRYEQCKNMLKVYTENEKSLKQQIESMNSQIHEKEEMYKALQSRTQEMLDKANTEVAIVKKAGDAQAAVLKAQLKKAELKISSLESDVKHIKIENGKLSSICDELMAKVSET